MNNHPITNKEREIVATLRENSELWERLAAKCRREGMTPFAVLREWGHPET